MGSCTFKITRSQLARSCSFKIRIFASYEKLWLQFRLILPAGKIRLLSSWLANFEILSWLGMKEQL
jgi:hypothetical protein